MTTDVKLSKKEFIALYSAKELKLLVAAVVEWVIYAENSNKQINNALVTLSKHRDALSKVMDLTVPHRLYRGIAIDKDNFLNKTPIGFPFLFKQQKLAESWSSFKSALSFAASKEWHENFGDKDVGLVINLLKPQQQVTILAPAHKTEKWFEKLINDELTDEQKENRQDENEYLIEGSLIKSMIVKKVAIK